MIPSSYNGLPVTKIANDGFDAHSSLTFISIPNSITVIGDYAFSECSSLISVTIPASVINIGFMAFAYCTDLTSIRIMNPTPGTLGTEAFGYANNYPIYVPADSVDAYKTHSTWSNYADRIFAIEADPIVGTWTWSESYSDSGLNNPTSGSFGFDVGSAIEITDSEVTITMGTTVYTGTWVYNDVSEDYTITLTDKSDEGMPHEGYIEEVITAYIASSNLVLIVSGVYEAFTLFE